MQCSYFAQVFCLLAGLTVASKPEPSTKCNIRESSEVTDQQSIFYTVECQLGGQSSLSQLPSVLRSTPLQGDPGQNGTAIKPESVDEFHLTGDVGQLPHRAFAWLPSLRRLFIDAGPGPLLTHETTFQGLPRLTALTINANFTEYSVAPNEVFPDSLRATGQQLEALTFQDASLKGELGQRDLKHFPNLRQLTIHNSPALSLSNDNKAFPANGRFQKMDLERVSMTQYPNSIRSLTNLKYLRLENVQLTQLPSDTFSSFADSINELRIEKNLLSDLHPALFSRMKSLKILSLANNRITSLPHNIFADTSRLDELNLSGNRISIIPERELQNLSALNKLDLSGNQLTNITERQLEGLENKFEHLLLQGNRIQSLGLANQSNQLGVSLAGNGIRHLRKGFFGKGSSFERLILDDNPLDRIDSGAFSGVSIGSGDMYIQRVNTTWLDLAAFDGMKSDGNQIQIIISGCPNLKGVNVSQWKVDWPSGVQQVVFTNNPRFVLAQPDDQGDQLSRFVRKHDVQFLFDGYVLCSCRWNWLRVKYPQRDDRTRIVDFAFYDSSTSIPCCNIPNVLVDEFLESRTFEKYCNGTIPKAPETAVQSCANFDANEVEEAEAKRK